MHSVIRESLLPRRTHHPIRASGVPAALNGRRALLSAMLGLALWLSGCELAGVQRCERASTGERKQRHGERGPLSPGGDERPTDPREQMWWVLSWAGWQ